ncbi:MAG: hypothetical protein HYZ27_02985 [Deltaproteobacteria bacterium]|nr:hypothetical protein [Deltaproteobacteria bacterium]
MRLCTAGCDFDCPDGGACVGPDGDGACALLCTDTTDCLDGTVCAVPDSSLIPPGQPVESVCLPACAQDSDCASTSCANGACSAPRIQPRPPPPPTPDAPSCRCATQDTAAFWLVALAGLRRRRARAALTHPGAQPASS